MACLPAKAGPADCVAPYGVRRNAERNAGYQSMSVTPALARGFIGNLKANASKMETIISFEERQKSTYGR
ncbi:hypothetical protein [Algoriphagus faecimaris]|nr:hypothetical protein [Algoriphagus faecimaris]